jgi:hypothetical protein
MEGKMEKINEAMKLLKEAQQELKEQGVNLNWAIKATPGGWVTQEFAEAPIG